MLSRVADSIYWLCRYTERAENLARFVDVNLNLNLDLPEDLIGQWEPLVRTTGDYDQFMARYGTVTPENVIRFLGCDEEYANSIRSCIRNARENARSVREAISSEMWEQINRLYLDTNRDRTAAVALEDPPGFFRSIKQASHLFFGIMHATMSHNEGWHFGRLGQHLERADKTSRILDMKYFILLPAVQDVGTPFDNLQWASLLKSASAYEMYRKKYGRIDYQHVAEFLTLDKEFPRSVHYCLAQALLSLHRISGSPEGSFANPAEKRLGRLNAELDFTQIEDIIGSGLHEFLDNLQAGLNEVANAIHDEYIALRPVSSPEAATVRQGLSQ